MTILRIRKKETNFLVLDKTCLVESSLSWGAKGLHAYLMSLPSEWRVNVQDLKNRATNGRDSVRGLLSELERAGYIARVWVRCEETGKYSGLEYLVHEVPQVLTCESPGTGLPETGFQETANPGTEKPTLVSIKNNKYTNKKIIRAAASDELLAPDLDKGKKAAAAFMIQKTNAIENTPVQLTAINQVSPEDSILGKTLTPYQFERVESLVETLKNQAFSVPVGEIEHCLVSPQYFKGSGQDFARKLNAIRIVIVRGGWQTPAGMVLLAKEKLDTDALILQAQLHSAQAEVNHFQRLLESATGLAGESIAGILTRSRQKMEAIEASLNKSLAQEPQFS